MLVYGKCECFVMHMMYVCVLCVPVVVLNAECLLLFTPSCCSECFYDLYRFVCVYTEMLSMGVLYVSFGSKVRPRTFGCVPWVVHCCAFLGPDCLYILHGLA